MNNALRTIACAGLAAGATYYFDPLLGKRRRSLLRDQWIRASTRSVHAARVVGRDSSNRLQGRLAQMRSGFAGRYQDDEALVARIRSKLGRLVSHPSAIEVAVHDGSVTLSGPILAREVDRLINGIRSMPEAPRVESQLEVHREPGNVSALQGGRRRRDAAFWQSQYWSPAAQAAACLAATAFAATALTLFGPRRWFPLALGGVIAAETAKIWSDERRESTERKSNRLAPFDEEVPSGEPRLTEILDNEPSRRGVGSSTDASTAGSRETIIHDL
jgi:hypothetical protein